MEKWKSCLLVMSLALVFVLFSGVAEAVTFKTTGSPTDTATGTNIIATKEYCSLIYKDLDNNLKPTVTPETDVTVAVVSEYGFSGIGTPADQNTSTGTPVYYSYVATNEGNASDTINLTKAVSYGLDGPNR
jgi:hypothetical protein